MKDSIYLSRSFVEFGPFSPAEMQDFYKRGVLKDTDYVSSDSNGAWLHVSEWAATLKAAETAKPSPKLPSAPAPTAAPATKAAKPVAAKKAPAKKAAKKA
jgi:hypothetical protein